AVQQRRPGPTVMPSGGGGEHSGRRSGSRRQRVPPPRVTQQGIGQLRVGARPQVVEEVPLVVRLPQADVPAQYRHLLLDLDQRLLRVEFPVGVTFQRLARHPLQRTLQDERSRRRQPLLRQPVGEDQPPHIVPWLVADGQQKRLLDVLRLLLRRE